MGMGMDRAQSMLNLYQSNEMSELARVFCERRTAGQDPLIPRTVVVQSFGIGQWLKLQLAERDGIAANIDCVLPANFLWRLYQTLTIDAEAPADSPYDPERLVWRVMRLISENPGLSGAIRNYLAAGRDSDLHLYQLAREITLLFDEYLMYRPSWVLDWEASAGQEAGHAAWQAKLWRLIQHDAADLGHLHRAALHQATMTELESMSRLLPWRQLSVFGLSTMPPLQLRTFEKLAQHIDVDIYFQNPCRHYWGDIISQEDKTRRSIRSIITSEAPLADEDYLEVGNPLLSSLGKQGREFLEILLESAMIHSDEAFLPAGGKTILHYIRNDILELTYGGAFADETPARFDSVDNSIQIHCCHSRMREVEVLHDEILRAMASDKTLQTRDIIVMVPNIAEYAPFIEATFSNSLNYRITDRDRHQTGSLITTLLQLLQLPKSRLTAPDVVDLLEVPAIMHRFGFNPNDLETMVHWIKAAEIRWEYSGARKTEYWQLPAEHQNTWQFGLKRLLLGFAMSPEQGPWENSLPLAVSPEETELLGTLCHLIDQLDHYRERFHQPQTMSQWQTLALKLLDDFFLASGDEVLEISQVQEQLESLAAAAETGRYKMPISYQLLVHALEQGLAKTGTAGFISGGITFAALVPMRNIPFRMVCLMGMNDGEYPREVRPQSFDLIAAGPAQRGDRSKKLDDRYLFLEALLSARDIFYVSYIGRSMHDNKDRPPSAVLSQLQTYLAEIFPELGTLYHALQPFNAIYYQGDDRASFTSTWYQALQEPKQEPFIETPLRKDQTLVCTHLAQLSSFLQHPGQYFLNQRLGAYLNTQSIELVDAEPFALDNLESFWLEDQALTTLVRMGNLDAFRQATLSSGQVLSGTTGREQLERVINRADQVYQAITPHLTESPATRTGEFRFGDQTLQIQLTNLHNGQLVQFRAGRLRARDELSLWVNHLAANIFEPTPSIFIGRGRSNAADACKLEPLDENEARHHLQQLLNYYAHGIDVPLFLPAKASRTFVATCQQGQDGETALTKTRAEWFNDRARGEGRDRYWQRLFLFPQIFYGRFGEDALAIWQPILEASHD